MEALLFAFLAVIVGLGLVFMGYAAFRILLPIVGFLAGLWLGMDIVKDFSMNYPLMGVSLGLILGLVLGGIFAAVAYLVYSLAVVIFGISIGYALGAGIMIALGNTLGITTPIINFIVGIVVAVALGIAFMRVDMPKLYIMGLTAFAGASALIAGILVLFGQIPPSQLGLSFVNAYIGQSWFWILIWVIIGSVGFFVQYQMVQMSQTLVPEAYSYDVTKKELEQKAKKS
jgi:hypothetical protein